MTHVAYFNDTIVPHAELASSVNDLGFSRAYTAFELFRCYGDRPFLLDAHLARLMHALDYLGIPAPVSDTRLRKMIADLITRHQFQDSFFKIYITAGEGDALATKCIGESQLFLSQSPLTVEDPEFPLGRAMYEPGLRLQTVEAERMLPEIKTTIYTAALLYRQRAMQAGFDDILYIDCAGHVTESSSSNIFFVRDSRLITPMTGMLEGITRMHVLALAEQLGISVELRNINRAELPSFEEAFVTSSVKEICPVSQIDDHDLGAGIDFPITQKLRGAFRESLLD